MSHLRWQRRDSVPYDPLFGAHGRRLNVQVTVHHFERLRPTAHHYYRVQIVARDTSGQHLLTTWTARTFDSEETAESYAHGLSDILFGSGNVHSIQTADHADWGPEYISTRLWWRSGEVDSFRLAAILGTDALMP